MSMTPILEAQDLAKKYGDFEAIKGISFSVEESEIFGLLGPNGAGKTTTISVLTGILPPTSGTALIGGYDIRTQMNRVKRLTGLVPQDLALYPTLSARANLYFFGRIYGLRGRALRERVEDALNIVSLTDRADQPVEVLSGGLKRRVNIAAGLVHQPRLLFLDEPTVGVDVQSRNHIFESIQKLNHERGMSIIYTSHYMEEVELLCDRAAIIDEGHIIAMDTIKNLIGLLGGGVIYFGLPRVDAHLLTQIAALPAVKEALPIEPASTGGRQSIRTSEESTVVKVVAEHSRQALVSVIGWLNEQEIPLISLDILEPSLESVFLHLTGKNLRE